MTDDQLESLLTRQGEAWRAAQPGAPALSAMTGTPKARAPWLLPALVAAALLIPVVGTVVVLQRHDPVTRRGVAGPAVSVLVPWADLPATAAPPRSPPGADDELPAGTRACAAGDFTADDDAATPTYAVGGPLPTGRYLLTVHRVGTGPCAIGGSTPTVELLDAAGTSLGIARSGLLAYTGIMLLQPGDVVQVPVRICGTGVTSLELRLAAVPAEPGMVGSSTGGAAVAVPLRGPSNCAAGASGISHQRVLPAGSLDSLVRSYSVPRRLRSGQRLDYTLTLTNPGPVPVPLDPCPSYRQSLIDVLELPDKKGATSTNQLNCAAAPASVPAHGSVIFQLRLDTTKVPPGDRRLVWDWLGSAMTDAQGYAQFPTVTVY